MSEEEYEEGEDGYVEDGGGQSFHREEGLAVALARQWGSAPWYVSSLFIHMVIFALLLLFAPEPKPQKRPAVDIKAVLPEEIEEMVPEDIPPPEEVQPEDQVEVEVSTEIKVETTIEVTPDVEVVQEESTPTDNTDFAELADELGEPATMGFQAVATAGGGKGGKFSGRSAANRGKQVKTGGGSKASQDALERGLMWLARTQESNGSWNCSKYEGGNHDTSATSLAILAFLGAGNSAKDGKYRRNVRSAQEFLLTKRDAKTGRIGGYQYEAGITLMAMAEAWAMSSDRNLQAVVQGQVDDALKNQARNGGWGYRPVPDPVEAHVDTSVAGWWMMGLKSAIVAGANLDHKAMENALGYFKSVTKSGNDGVYTSTYTPGGGGNIVNMTAVGLTCLQFLGMDRNDPVVKGHAEYFMKNRGSMIGNNFKGGNPYYAWYYQALGMFQMGTRSTYWRTFVPEMEKVMLSLQEKSGRNAGSWPPQLPWQEKASHFESSVGRVGTTAIGCMILEVYYRYGLQPSK